jgi:enoyl-CoA hydratase/carnithine racemase
LTDFADYKDKFETVRLERSDDGILELTLHRDGGPYVWDARAGRSISYEELSECFHQVSRDRENRVVIITGTGDEFSGPPARLVTMSRGDIRHWERNRSLGLQMIMDLLDIPAPVIGVLNGPAYRHAEIPFTGDIVLAADDALIQDSAHFPNRIVPGDGIALILPYLMGLNRGRYFHFMGQKLAAAQMLEFGLVNEVMPRDQLLPRAREIAAMLVLNNPLALRNTRTLMIAPMRDHVQRYLDYGLALESLVAVDETMNNPLS